MIHIESFFSHDKLNRHLYAAFMIGCFALAWYMGFEFKSPDPKIDTIAVNRAGALAVGLALTSTALAIFDALLVARFQRI